MNVSIILNCRKEVVIFLEKKHHFSSISDKDHKLQLKLSEKLPTFFGKKRDQNEIN